MDGEATPHEDTISENGSAYSNTSDANPVPAKGRSPRKGAWLPEEDELLRQVLDELGGANAEVHSKWSTVASRIPGRSAKQCRERWCYNLDPSICKGPWTTEEDSLLLNSHAVLGNRWAHIASKLPGRTENSVKSRFKSLARAQKRAWSPEEDATILRMHHKVGCKWAVIAELLSNRTKNAVKTRYRTLVREGIQEQQQQQHQQSNENITAQPSSLLAKRSRPEGLFLDIDDAHNTSKRLKTEASNDTGLIFQALEQQQRQDKDENQLANLLAMKPKPSIFHENIGSVPAWTPRSGSTAINSLLSSLSSQVQVPLASPRSLGSLLQQQTSGNLQGGASISTITPQASPLNSPIITPEISPRANSISTISPGPGPLTNLIGQLLDMKRKQERDTSERQLVDLSLALLKSKAQADRSQAAPSSSEMMGMSAMLALAGGQLR